VLAHSDGGLADCSRAVCGKPVPTATSPGSSAFAGFSGLASVPSAFVPPPPAGGLGPCEFIFSMMSVGLVYLLESTRRYSGLKDITPP
jgi:hypothetical protein